MEDSVENDFFNSFTTFKKPATQPEVASESPSKEIGHKAPLKESLSFGLTS